MNIKTKCAVQTHLHVESTESTKSNAPNIKDKVYYKDTYCAVNFQTLYLYSYWQEGTAT